MNFLENNPECAPYVERLEQEWNQHGKIIIAVDYDDTISPWKMQNMQYDWVIDILKTAQQTGAYIVIFTACNPDRYDEIRDYCISKGLKVDSINENPISLPYGNNKKIYANIFIDDRAGLHQAIQILQLAMYRVRGKKQNYENW